MLVTNSAHTLLRFVVASFHNPDESESLCLLDPDIADIKNIAQCTRICREGEVRQPLKDYRAMFEELKDSTDRAVGIVAAAYLEDALLDNILDRLKIESDDITKELLNNGAPFATFSNKIIFAYAIGVIGEKTRKDCDIIRKIRNVCAHNVNLVSFSLTDQLKGLASALQPRLWGGNKQ